MRALVPLTLLFALAGCTPAAPTVDTSKPAIRALDGVLAAGQAYVVALDGRGQVFGWGGFEDGNGAHSMARLPRQIVDGSGYKRVAAGTDAANAASPAESELLFHIRVFISSTGSRGMALRHSPHGVAYAPPCLLLQRRATASSRTVNGPTGPEPT